MISNASIMRSIIMADLGLSENGVQSVLLPENGGASTLGDLAEVSHSFVNYERLVRHGFFAAIAFSMLGFLAVVAYLYHYAAETDAAFTQQAILTLHNLNSINEERQCVFVHLAVWEFALQSCGIMAGVVFGFLGLALFLLGIRGDINGQASVHGYSIRLNHMAPGTLVIVVSAVLICICATRHVGLSAGPVDPDAKAGGSQGPSINGYDSSRGAPARAIVPDPAVQDRR
jgi:hypothetical protein